MVRMRLCFVYRRIRKMRCAFVFFKQTTAYEMRISDWSSDVCSSDLLWACARTVVPHAATTEISEILRRDNKRDMADVLGLELRSRGVSPPCSIPLRIGWR